MSTPYAPVLPAATPSGANVQRLGDVLVALGLVTAQQLSDAVQTQISAPGTRLGDILLASGAITEDGLAHALAELHGVPLVDLTTTPVDADIARLLPRDSALRMGLMAYRSQDGRLSVAAADPIDVVALDDVRTFTGARQLEVAVAPRSQICAVIRRIWASVEDEAAMQAFVAESADADDADTGPDDQDAATVRLVDRILALAVRERASDIHLEPHRTHATVRLRVDGLLREVLEVPASGYPAMVSRLKIISGLDIIERRLPQDGRARLATSAGAVDVRVSSLPTMHGETVVLRLLGSATHLPHLHDLGLSEWHTTHLLTAVARPQGLILITGPTGSGKTNTLYALLADGIDATRSVLTLEDPIEIELPQITQMQVDERIGLDFARGLRASLRQDPDVVLVGEIRDQDTAELAIRAALTGHLVLSTLHTLDAASALTRLTDMGIAPYLLTSSLLLIASQRLLRRPCPHCARHDDTAEAALDELGIDPPTTATWLDAPGCLACQHTGYQGRIPVMELLPITADLRGPVLAGEDQLRDTARRLGYPDLMHHALAAASQAQTTLAEVLRAIPHPTPGRT